MSKTTAHKTVTPNRYTARNEVLAEDVVDVLEAQNHAVAEECHTLVARSTIAPGWGTAGDYERCPPGWRWGALAAGRVRKALGRTYVDPDAQSIRVDVGVTLATDDEGDVHVTIGGASAPLSFVALGDGPMVLLSRSGVTTVNVERLTASATLPVSLVGTGWVEIEVELEPIASSKTWSSDLAGLDHITVQGEKVPAASLPDPD